MGWERSDLFSKRLDVVISIVILFLHLSCVSSSTHRELTHTERAFKFLEIARAALMEGDPTGALQTLLLAEREDSTIPSIYHFKALAFFAKHDLQLAIANAEKAVKMNQNDSDTNNTLGKLYMEAGRYDTALAPLLSAAKDPLYRDAYKAWTNLGILKYQQGDYKNSREFLDQAILADPFKSCIAYYYRGNISLKESQLKLAIENYSRATKKFCASYGEAYLALGLAYQKNRQYDFARKTFLEIQKLYPNTPISDQAIDYLKYLP